MAESKPLGHDDSSGFEFVREILKGDVTAAINFDRIQKHPKRGYLIFEFLLCEEAQTVTPYTSHPSKYWHKNSQKFLALWRVAQDLQATLFLVNYAKRGTKHEDEVLVIKVLKLETTGITDEKVVRMKRIEFSNWFRQLNRESL